MKKIMILAVGGFFLISTASVWGEDKVLLSIIQRLTEEKIAWSHNCLLDHPYNIYEISKENFNTRWFSCK